MADAFVNHWRTYPTGQNFLGYLKDTSAARNFCRQKITDMIQGGNIQSLLEVGIGGLNEFLSLKETFDKQPNFRYTGVDWTTQFINDARSKFPSYNFQQLDITQCGVRDDLKSDIVYTQHVLEHCPGLNPPLSNMLQMANLVFINIFFLGPAQVEFIDYSQYPLYHNAYSYDHIIATCKYHGFNPMFLKFDNREVNGHEQCMHEVALVAIKQTPS